MMINNLYGCTVSGGLVPFSPDMDPFRLAAARDHAMYCAKGKRTGPAGGLASRARTRGRLAQSTAAGYCV
jgi:hypothetical protein